jgi:hypothetical protein
MAHDHLIQLIGSHKVRIARALSRQVRGLSPNYASLDTAALEASFIRVLGHVGQFLTTGDDASLKNHAAHTAQLRSALGFRIDDFMMATLVFLPIIRQFLLEHARDLPTGLREYEAFEAAAIPVMAEAATSFRRAMAGHETIGDDDLEDEITTPTHRAVVPARRASFTLETVTGEADEELDFLR